MSRVRTLARWLGFRVHKGWRSTHSRGYRTDIECIGCGERQMLYCLCGWYGPRDPSWWETTASGDGSCGEIPELPARFL